MRNQRLVRIGLTAPVGILPVMPMPAWRTGNQTTADVVREMGLARAYSAFTLLRDHYDSTAWPDWFAAANLPPQTRKQRLIIPDANVWAQAVLDGHGIALHVTFLARDVKHDPLVPLSEVELSSYGYCIARPPGHQPPSQPRSFCRLAANGLKLPLWGWPRMVQNIR